jgi:hypothetical protein
MEKCLTTCVSEFNILFFLYLNKSGNKIWPKPFEDIFTPYAIETDEVFRLSAINVGLEIL